jgi:hypothetical protein
LLFLLILITFPFAILYLITAIYLRIKFSEAALRQGKFIIFVYSDSPNWKDYIEANILPIIRQHTILLNWSERRNWESSSWIIKAFKHWGGESDFNPMAIVRCNFFKIQIIRFNKAFHENKFGKADLLKKVESELIHFVNIQTSKLSQ